MQERKKQAVRSMVSCPSGDTTVKCSVLTATCRYARPSATSNPTDTSRQHGTGRHNYISIDDGEITGDGVRAVRRRCEVSHSRNPKESKKDENVRQ
jgi:hypothetical protein